MRKDPRGPEDDLAMSILEASSNCIMVLDLEGQITSLNDAGARSLELENRQALDGQDWTDLWSGQHHSDASDAIKGARRGQRGGFTANCLSARGTVLWWDVVVSPVKTASGDVARIAVIAHDLTETRRASEEVDVARNSLDAVLSSTTDSIVVVDHDWNLIYLNEQAASSVGRNGRLAIGENIWEAYPEQVGTVFQENYLRALKTQTPVTFEGYLIELGVWLEVRAFPTGSSLSIFFHDITEAKKARDEIYRLAHHDALTGLPNRAMFLKTLETSLAEAVVSRGSRAVVHVDLDDFKNINDTLGHDAGDAMLVAAAQRLRKWVPASGLVGRVGGDEFALLLCEEISMSQVEILMAELKDAMNVPVSYMTAELSCRASFGVALFPQSDNRPSELMKNADLALYSAKRAGGNQHAFFDPQVRQLIQQRLSALSCARDALARDAILPFYQPKISFETGRVKGFEALLRWMHPREGIQPPFLIKDAFEDPILAVELGRRMRDKVIADMQQWRAAGVDFGSIAVNVSAQELVRANFSAEVLSRLKAAGLPSSMLEIEVTETVFLDDGSNRIENELNDLHQNGVSIALDDFGTGYASLTHLNKFPVSWLKIDQSFVKGLSTDPDVAAIVKAIMGLSHSLGIRVVAEGVETLEQWKLLKNRSCDLAQGYLISKPMSGGKVPHFIETWAGVQEEFPDK